MTDSKEFTPDEIELLSIIAYRILKKWYIKINSEYPIYTGEETIEFNGIKYRKMPNVARLLGIPHSSGCEGCFFTEKPLCPCNCINPDCIYVEVIDDNQTT